MRKSIRFCVLFLLIGSLIPRVARSAKLTGRFLLGAYASTERFKDPSGDSDSNDFAIASGQAFLKVEDWGARRLEFVADLRDKEDFFGMLDNERLHLVPSNDLQLRQMSLRNPSSGGGWGGQAGRFPVPEAGTVFVDGAQVERHFGPFLKGSAFGGFNPLQYGRAYLQFDQKATVYGASLTYQDRSGAWDKNLYLTHALVNQSYASHTDRFFFYENAIYQWSTTSRLISLFYLDFVPNPYLQTGNLVWQEGWSPYFSTDLSALGVDAIEYFRRQGVLETLPASPYSEASLQANLNVSSRARVFLKATEGHRASDGLAKTEALFGWVRSGLFSARWDATLTVGARRNFTSDDVFGRGTIGYFSSKWESTLDLSYANQQNDSGIKLHPLLAELSISNYLSRQLFSAISLQSASNESVSILSLFATVGYRYGNQELPPHRDGAPPRGAL